MNAVQLSMARVGNINSKSQDRTIVVKLRTQDNRGTKEVRVLAMRRLRNAEIGPHRDRDGNRNRMVLLELGGES